MIAAVAGMGLSVPGCPGTQALQQQVDELQAKNSELTRQVQTMDGSVKDLQKRMEDMTNLMNEVSGAVVAHKQTLPQLEGQVRELQEKMAAKAPSKAAPKRATKLPTKKKR